MIGDLELVHFRSERFKSRLFPALAVVQRALQRAKRPYIAFSTGKDSTVVAALVHAARPEVELVWSDDELELPETVKFVTDLQALAGSQLTITLGWAMHAGWFRPWVDEPYWRDPFPDALRIEQDVDDWMGSRGYDLTFLGTRMSENRRRRDWLVQTGPTYKVPNGTGRRCCPIWDWTEDDVWALIAGWGLAYNPAYDVMDQIGIPRKRQRIGPLPLAPRSQLLDGWSDLLQRLEIRYGARWQ